MRDLTAAFADVLQERERQILSEDFSLEHDDRHRDGELAKAAICMALGALQTRDYIVGSELAYGRSLLSFLWPWAPDWWRPKDYRRDLVRAAALLVAEIERVDRASLAQDLVPVTGARLVRASDPETGKGR